jgi:hypothetical protein
MSVQAASSKPAETAVTEGKNPAPKKAKPKAEPPKNTSAKTIGKHNPAPMPDQKSQASDASQTQPMFAAPDGGKKTTDSGDGILDSQPLAVDNSATQEAFEGTATDGPDGPLTTLSESGIDIATTHKAIHADLTEELQHTKNGDLTEFEFRPEMLDLLNLQAFGVKSGIKLAVNGFEKLGHQMSRNEDMEDATEQKLGKYAKAIEAFEGGEISKDVLSTVSRQARTSGFITEMAHNERLAEMGDILADTSQLVDNSAARGAGATKNPLALLYPVITKGVETFTRNEINKANGNSDLQESVWNAGLDIAGKYGKLFEGYTISKAVTNAGTTIQEGGKHLVQGVANHIINPTNALPSIATNFANSTRWIANNSVATFAALAGMTYQLNADMDPEKVYDLDDGRAVRFVSKDEYKQALEQTNARDSDGDPVLTQTIDNPDYRKAVQQLQRGDNGEFTFRGDFVKELTGLDNPRIIDIDFLKDAEGNSTDLIARYEDPITGQKRGVHIPKTLEKDVSLRNNSDPFNKGFGMEIHNDPDLKGVSVGGIDRGLHLIIYQSGDDAETLLQNNATTTFRTDFNGLVQGYEQKVNKQSSIGLDVVVGPGNATPLNGDPISFVVGAGFVDITRMRSGGTINISESEITGFAGQTTRNWELGFGMALNNIQNSSLGQSIPVIGKTLEKLSDAGESIAAGGFYGLAEMSAGVEGNIVYDKNNKKGPLSIGPNIKNGASADMFKPDFKPDGMFWVSTTQDLGLQDKIIKPLQTLFGEDIIEP